MAVVYENDLKDFSTLILRDPEPRIETWQGRKALRLSGQGPSLLIIPDLELSQGLIEIYIGTQGTAYPGIAFRIQDSLNYELAYPQPHTSGKWDAIQYDPVFHGSNTWQLYQGPGSQQVADVPLGDWFHFRVRFKEKFAAIQVGEQKPLFVKTLAHRHHSGLVGLWAYLPAYFSNLVVHDDPGEIVPEPYGESKNKGVGLVTEWFLEGYGKVFAEPSGILNLNRYLPATTSEVRLVRDFRIERNGDITIQVGFSDEVDLQIDGESVFSGENLYHNSPKWEERGYVSLDNKVSLPLNKGVHRLAAVLKSREFFGYGITLRVEGSSVQFLPAGFN